MSSYQESMLGFAFLEATLVADSTLLGLAPGGINRAYAQPSTPTPYVILIHQAGSDALTAFGFRIMTNLLYQVKVVGPATLSATLRQAAARIDRLLGGPPGGPISGPIVMDGQTAGNANGCYRESPLETDELVNGEVWSNVGGMYRLQIAQIAT